MTAPPEKAIMSTKLRGRCLGLFWKLEEPVSDSRYHMLHLLKSGWCSSMVPRLDLFPNTQNLTSNSLLHIIWTTFIGCLTDNSHSTVQTWTPGLLSQMGSIHSCPHWSEGNSLLFVSWPFCSLTPTASPSGKIASFNSIFMKHPYSNYFSLSPLLPPVLSHHPLSPRLM